MHCLGPDTKFSPGHAAGACWCCRCWVAGARVIDLAPSAQGGELAALPEVVIVFVQVVGGAGFSYKRNRSEAHALKKAVTRCMLQMLDELPETDEGRDGYLCRCQEADLKYMVSFKAAHMALQWCMLVQVRAVRGGAGGLCVQWLQWLGGADGACTCALGPAIKAVLCTKELLLHTTCACWQLCDFVTF